MRIASGLFVLGALTLGACAAPADVRSTSSASTDSGEQLPPVDDLLAPSTTNTPTTLPGTRPINVASSVLLASDLPGWNVVSPMDVPGEPTWEALDCPDMNTVWGATGRAGTRSRGTNGGASFRNTAVEFPTAIEAGDVLDAVEGVWSECIMFESDLGSFWSEPIVMPPSTFRTSGLVIGSADNPNWTLAFWQIDTMVVVLEVEGDEMWTSLNPLLITLSARLDGTPTPFQEAVEEPSDELPVLVPATSAPADPAATSTTSTTIEPQDDTFPPSDEGWTEHPLAHLAPTPEALGPGWTFDGGSSNQAEPADPDDAIDGCDAPVPTPLDGYELSYENRDADAEIEVMVGGGTAAESQTWIDAFRAIAGCDLDMEVFLGNFDLVDVQIEGADDAVVIAGVYDFEGLPTYAQVIGAARVDGTIVAAFVAFPVDDDRNTDAAIAQVVDVVAMMLAAR